MMSERPPLETPKLATNLRYVDNAFIAPDGKIFECGWECHDDLARALGYHDTSEAMKVGYLHLSDGKINNPANVGCPEPTQAQLNSIFDWQQAWSQRTLPEWCAFAKLDS
jgi:hypothetical protein